MQHSIEYLDIGVILVTEENEARDKKKRKKKK
jgi:hypothetical protein